MIQLYGFKTVCRILPQDFASLKSTKSCTQNQTHVLATGLTSCQDSMLFLNVETYLCISIWIIKNWYNILIW